MLAAKTNPGATRRSGLITKEHPLQRVGTKGRKGSAEPRQMESRRWSYGPAQLQNNAVPAGPSI
ncbi:hypothetical protein J6590_047025 [Homalodisca vitripennis]|nr:hypothetical protein J6590_066332 [Homalodisca vitripennis]KAG8287048.1 hypothetical protein J6590_047025 [Homalodisca vitripennis]